MVNFHVFPLFCFCLLTNLCSQLFDVFCFLVPMYEGFDCLLMRIEKRRAFGFYVFPYKWLLSKRKKKSHLDWIQ